MPRFEFDSAPSAGTNRTATVTDCPTCGGDRFVPVPDDKHEVYARCPDCNSSPTGSRKPAPEDAWWKR